jgi:benzoyl-CoA reductase/2-hydroxyglutaryl-CoA dehydratase subunit BcrC/BadD/HgdB
MWLQESIQFRHPLIKMLEGSYQAAVVVDELNDVYWEPIDANDPYVGLARRTIAFPFNGRVERRLKQIKKLVEEYKIDGAINPCHWGCRQGTGSRGLVNAALKELDIPVINLEVDCADSRNFAEGQLKTRLEAFMELLGSRRGGRSMN